MLISRVMIGKAVGLQTSHHGVSKLFAISAVRLRAVERACAAQGSSFQSLSFHGSSKIFGSHFFEEYKATIGFPQETVQSGESLGQQHVNSTMIMHGYLVSRKDMSKNMSFAELLCKDLKTKVQFVGFRKNSVGNDGESLSQLRNIKLHSPVVAIGIVQKKQGPKGLETDEIELHLQKIQPLNSFPTDLVMSKDRTFLPEQRHLQIRSSESLRDALKFRSIVAARCRQVLLSDNFDEIETPILFKSTPEGAREFLVPSRRRGMAYALPQSPQQYKQILMASGMQRYFQIARCFRDEDLRADRQPEFTQLDLEMAFANEEDVMKCIENLIVDLWKFGLSIDIQAPFHRMTYAEAMRRFGSDKPDLRFGMEIIDVTDQMGLDYRKALGKAPQILEAIKVRLAENVDAEKVQTLWETIVIDLKAVGIDTTVGNPKSPQLWQYKSNESCPVNFSEELIEKHDIRDGDIFITLPRPAEEPTGGSTEMGRLRLITQSCLEALGLDSSPKGYKFLWVTDFPLLTPNDFDPSNPEHLQTPSYISTHHPFTAPKTPEDVDLLATNPQAAKAAHYDLVVNGVELGGGSRRIHDAKMQDYILRKVLKLSNERVHDFAHLLGVLETGCPPHAGIALGFDRLIAVMRGVASVRDVIAFPKSGSGEDPLVGSPGELTEKQLETYHLKLREDHESHA